MDSLYLFSCVTVSFLYNKIFSPVSASLCPCFAFHSCLFLSYFHLDVAAVCLSFLTFQNHFELSLRFDILNIFIQRESDLLNLSRFTCMQQLADGKCKSFETS